MHYPQMPSLPTDDAFLPDILCVKGQSISQGQQSIDSFCMKPSHCMKLSHRKLSQYGVARHFSHLLGLDHYVVVLLLGINSVQAAAGAMY